MIFLIKVFEKPGSEKKNTPSAKVISSPTTRTIHQTTVHPPAFMTKTQPATKRHRLFGDKSFTKSQSSGAHHISKSGAQPKSTPEAKSSPAIDSMEPSTSSKSLNNRLKTRTKRRSVVDVATQSIVQPPAKLAPKRIVKVSRFYPIILTNGPVQRDDSMFSVIKSMSFLTLRPII